MKRLEDEVQATSSELATFLMLYEERVGGGRSGLAANGMTHTTSREEIDHLATQTRTDTGERESADRDIHAMHAAFPSMSATHTFTETRENTDRDDASAQTQTFTKAGREQSDTDISSSSFTAFPRLS